MRTQVLRVKTSSGIVEVLADEGVRKADLKLVAELLKRTAEGPYEFKAIVNGLEILGCDAETMAQLAERYGDKTKAPAIPKDDEGSK